MWQGLPLRSLVLEQQRPQHHLRTEGRGRGPCSRLPRQSRALASQRPQEREILSGGMKPVSPRALSATRPSGRTTRWVMLPLLRERRSQPSGGNCSALGGGERAA